MQMLLLPSKCQFPFLNLKKQAPFFSGSSEFNTLIGNGKEITFINVLQIDWMPYFVRKSE